VSKFELTFDEWDTCFTYGDCPHIDDRVPPVMWLEFGVARSPVT